MIWGSISGFIMMLGFAYIIWALAMKDSSNSKIWGQVIAALVLIVAVINIIVGITGYGHRARVMKGEWMDQQKMMEKTK